MKESIQNDQDNFNQFCSYSVRFQRLNQNTIMVLPMN